MKRMIYCVKLRRLEEGLNYPPYAGQLGYRIWTSISKSAWGEWKKIKTQIVNEYNLNLSNIQARKYLLKQMILFLFEEYK